MLPSLEMQLGITGALSKPARGDPSRLSAYRNECLGRGIHTVSMQVLYQRTNHVNIPLPLGILWDRTRRMLNTFRNVKPLLLPYGLLRISGFKA